MTRLTEWKEVVDIGLVRVCTTCDHGPGYHQNPKTSEFGGETITRPGGCSITGCACQVTLAEIAADAHRIAEEEEEAAELARQRAEAEFWCADCQQAVDEPDTRYECGNCGCEFGLQDSDSNRCPDCGKFAAKASENACPDCGEELEEGGV